MKISMSADFRILKKSPDGVYVPMVKNELKNLSIGGYSFAIGDVSIPFDWTAYTCNWEGNDTYLNAVTGYGWMNDFELDECFDSEYEKLGIKREGISAKMLSSTHHIEEFFVYFDIDGSDGLVEGCVGDNTVNEASYKLELLKVSFEDVETSMFYDVNPDVLMSFNKGEHNKSIENLISNAEVECEELNKNSVAKNNIVLGKEQLL